MLRLISRRDEVPDASSPWVQDAEESVQVVAFEDQPEWLRRIGAPGVRQEDLDPTTVVCECLQVSLATLRSCVERGCHTVDALAEETGATTACGGCTGRVAGLVASASGLPVRVVEVRQILPNVRSIRLKAVDPARTSLRGFRPGQHMVVSGLVGGLWVSRPYTLTSPAGESSFYEVSVKLEPDGALSPWLFGPAAEFSPIRITSPRGDFCPDLQSPEPAVFLVAGIGVTPALAVVRTLATDGGRKRVHIDYSARSASEHAFRDELEALAAAHENITVRFRETRNGERLGARDVRGLRHDFRSGRFFICGPERYQEDVSAYLLAAGIRKERIRLESFRPGGVGARGAEPAARSRSTLSSAIALLLLLAYLAQAAFDWSWAWLEGLQQQEGYRRWSGAVLLAFVAAQWVLPVLRLRGRLRAAATAYPWHRWIGALAPAFFFAHATRLGYGYLLALGSVYLANVAVGLADKTLVRDPARRERYARRWVVAHVALACLTVGLALFHVFVVFAYK